MDVLACINAMNKKQTNKQKNPPALIHLYKFIITKELNILSPEYRLLPKRVKSSPHTHTQLKHFRWIVSK